MPNHTNIQTRLRELGNPGGRSGRQALENLIEVSKGITRVLEGNTSMKSSDGGTISTTVYQVDVSAGEAIVGGTGVVYAALDDQDLLTIGEIKHTTLTGVAPTALTAGQSVIVRLGLVLLSDLPVLVAFFGTNVIADAAVALTLAQCRTAMRAATASGLITGWVDSPLGLVFAEVEVARTEVITLTYTGTPDLDPGDVVTIDYDGTEEVNYTILSAVLNDEVAAIEALLDTALTAEPLTVTVAAGVITITADAGVVLDAVASVVTVGDGGDLAVAVANADTMAETHTDPAADVTLMGQRAAGSFS